MATKKYPGSSNLLAIFNNIKSNFASKLHNHGNITADGKVGTEAGKVLMTDTGGSVIASDTSAFSSMLDRGFSAVPVTLLTTGWDSANATITVTALGVTSTNSVVISPTPSSFVQYTAAGIMCSTQGENSLTFSCTEIPTEDLSVNILIFDTEATPEPLTLSYYYIGSEPPSSSLGNEGDLYLITDTK